MSDTNQSSGLAKSTQTELDAAAQANAKQQQERERLQAIANAYRECEARLQLTREQIEQLIASSAPANAASTATNSTAAGDDSAVQNIFDLLNQLAADPFALVKSALPDAPQTPSPAAPENAGGLSDTPPVPATTPILPFAAGANANAPQPDFPPSVAAIPPAVSQAAPAAADFSAGAELQALGERLRSALEQNTQATASLFEQLLALMDNQNRKLGQLDQKISELAGQLQSLKNP